MQPNFGDNNLESAVISILRFPMALLILLHHSSFRYELLNGNPIFEGWQQPLYRTLDNIFVGNFTAIAVPLFFLVSGYLFFLKTSEFSFDDYISKISKRIKSLLIPYLLWNFLFLCLYFVAQTVFPSMSSGRNKIIEDYSIIDYVSSFWSMKYINGGNLDGPIDGPLWFVRDLMIMCLLSPVIYIITKKTKLLFPICLVTLYISGIWRGFSGVSISALTFFTIGSYLGINKSSFAKSSLRLLPYTICSYILLLVLMLFKDEFLCLRSVEIIIGIALVIGLATSFVSKGYYISKLLIGSTFFIFAGHAIFLQTLIRITSNIGVRNDLFYCLMFFVCPAITLVIVLTIYCLLKKACPKLASLLAGGR